MPGKGRYAGCRMTVYGTILPGAISIARWAARVERLTPDGKQRLKILDWHRAHGKIISLTARHFGIRRATVREWLKRFTVQGILGLVERSRRPQRMRPPTTSPDAIIAVVRLRKQYPAWSKYKLRVMLARQGITLSASTVGRILKRQGLINQGVSRKRRRAALHPRARCPHGMRISRPGDLIQIDTKHLILIGGRKLYQFTAIDVLTKQRVLRCYPSLASRNGAEFLRQCLENLPCPVRAVQTDNGSEFLREFDRLCRERGIPHFFIYPRTPKQNTYVEISHGADKKEFYQQGNACSDRARMNEKLMEWQGVWNTVRPHTSLNYLTPQEYFEKWQSGRLPTRDVITLQT